MTQPFEKLSWEVSLIDPSGFAEAAYRRKPARKLFPHIGLGYLAASLERNGEKVSVLDAGVEAFPQIQHFLSQPVNLVGITTTSFTFRESVALAREIKKRYPLLPVLLGGPHTSIDPDGCLMDPAVDYAIAGEGEEAMVDLLEVLKRQRQPRPEILKQIAGLVFRNGDKIEVNTPVPRKRNLDQIPYPAWHLFPMPQYDQQALLTSRGCPRDCAFCAIKSIWGDLWIHRDPEQVVCEMAWVQKRWGRKLIHINDDNLTMNPQHVMRFCEEIIRRRLLVNWVAQGVRADAVTLELLKLMRRAGCHRVSLGIESAAPEVLEAIGKKETPADMARAVHLCQAAGIQSLGMFMVGNPGDTEATVRASIQFARETRIDLPAFYMALPYPRTRLWEYVRQHGRWLDANYLAFNHMSREPVFETPEFTAAERRRVFAQAARFSWFRLVKYHLFFWWPTRLLQRNGYEIKTEFCWWLKKLVLLPSLWRFLRQRIYRGKR